MRTRATALAESTSGGARLPVGGGRAPAARAGGGLAAGKPGRFSVLRHELVRREVEILSLAFGIRLHLHAAGEDLGDRMPVCGISRGRQKMATRGEASAIREQCRRFHMELNNQARLRSEPAGCLCHFGLMARAWPVLCHGVPAGELWVGGIASGDDGAPGHGRQAMTGFAACAGVPRYTPEQWACISELIQRTADGIGRILEDLEVDEDLAPEEKAMAWLQENTFRPVQAGEIAKVAAVTTQHLCRLWHRRFGENMGSSIARIRVRRAMRLLDACPERKIIDIALDCGFGSLSQFNRVFLKIAGLAPSEVRKLQREKHARA